MRRQLVGVEATLSRRQGLCLRIPGNMEVRESPMRRNGTPLKKHIRELKDGNMNGQKGESPLTCTEYTGKSSQNPFDINRLNLWNRLIQKAGLANRLGRFGAGWTWADDALLDRLAVEMGYSRAKSKK
jgi:hypothetical protein